MDWGEKCNGYIGDKNCLGVENGEHEVSLNIEETENENMDYVNKTNIVFISVFTW